MELEIWHLWLLLTIGLFIIEVITSSFSSMCFGLGALCTGILAYSNYPTSVQLVVFLTISAISLLVLKPYLKHKLVSRSGVITNIHSSYIGREAFVLEEINALKKRGKIIIGGIGKKAISESGEIIPEGAFVIILKSNSTEVVVKKA
jgi:membrane protein implicated in regulation of membrane protease activity